MKMCPLQDNAEIGKDCPPCFGHYNDECIEKCPECEKATKAKSGLFARALTTLTM